MKRNLNVLSKALLFSIVKNGEEMKSALSLYDELSGLMKKT